MRSAPALCAVVTAVCVLIGAGLHFAVSGVPEQLPTDYHAAPQVCSAFRSIAPLPASGARMFVPQSGRYNPARSLIVVAPQSLADGYGALATQLAGIPSKDRMRSTR